MGKGIATEEEKANSRFLRDDNKKGNSNYKGQKCGGVRGLIAEVFGAKNLNFHGIYEKNVPVFEQNREKPEKTCGNRRKGVDKARGKAEGELRYRSPHPHEHW